MERIVEIIEQLKDMNTIDMVCRTDLLNELFILIDQEGLDCFDVLLEHGLL